MSETDYAVYKHKTFFNLGIAYRNNKDRNPEKTKENIDKSIEAFKKAQTTCPGIAKAATANNLGLSLFDDK